ncbi:hypothetical protein Herbaro_02675 [Herbaspirillum sp. WKF16]|uniref:hypothetical protein n=1 Tax=Herbaspirillum sp. WKF16 TaxID=3028312 RepID=UPI0023A9C4DE|nr:hypothetical protein [Herbaspirillum sp. WKF16]WDZ96708.1 hypothetical protein Herbaro_02675 [Herbaspirillum sp. WKF16]
MSNINQTPGQQRPEESDPQPGRSIGEEDGDAASPGKGEEPDQPAPDQGELVDEPSETEPADEERDPESERGADGEGEGDIYRSGHARGDAPPDVTP